MIRTILIDFALFLLPFVLYWLYLKVKKRNAADEAAGRAHPWVALFCAGLVLAIGGLVVLGIQNTEPPSPETYHPHWQAPKRTAP